MRQRRQFDSDRVVRLYHATCKNDGHDARLADQFAIGGAVQHSIQKPGLEILYLGAGVAQAGRFQNDFIADPDQRALGQTQQIDTARGDVLAKVGGRNIEPLSASSSKSSAWMRCTCRRLGCVGSARTRERCFTVTP